MLVPQTMLVAVSVPHAVAPRSGPAVPHTMFSPSVVPMSPVPHTMFVPHTMLVPHTMFWAHAASFEKTDVPQTMLVPQTMFCDHASACPSIVVDVSTPDASHHDPTGADVSIAFASSAAPATFSAPAP